MKCVNVTDNSTNIELNYALDRINRLYSNCINCGCKERQLLMKKI